MAPHASEEYQNGNQSAIASAQRYFDTNPPPEELDAYSAQAKAFIDYHVKRDRRVALVTSGGTTVPLENQTVRFIDNFSAGTRGACSAEYLLQTGYAVIFLHRKFSLLPYARHYSHSTNCFLDFMKEDSRGQVVVDQSFQEDMIKVLRRYTAAKDNNMLLSLSFTTINEYLWSLREIARSMQPLGSKALFYLAAAVSDFFVPKDRMVEHKIQSGEEFSSRNARQDGSDGKVPAARTEGKSLIIDLDPVPKFLKQLVDSWSPEGMIVSFKLETDPSILEEKAKHSLKKYSHHLVIGNLLSTRKWEVVFVSQGGVQWIRVPRKRRTKSFSGLPEHVGLADTEGAEWLDGDEDGDLPMEGEPPIEIESLIIPRMARLHEALIEKSKKGRPVH